MRSLEILYEDNHLLVINKPAGIATMGAEAGVPTIHSMAADYLKKAYSKPGRAYVGIVSRLDSMTTGVLVLARTSKAAARLSEQFSPRSGSSSHATCKIYVAAVEGRLDTNSGVLLDAIRKDDAARRMRVADDTDAGAQLAELRYVIVGSISDATIVAVQLQTGRKHQIRVQFADRGHPIIGDRKYGSKRSFSPGIALHSRLLQIIHPTRREPMWFEASLPESWKPFRHAIPSSDELQRRIADAINLPGRKQP